MSAARFAITVVVSAVAVSVPGAPIYAELAAPPSVVGEFSGVGDRFGGYSTSRLIVKVREGISLSVVDGVMRVEGDAGHVRFASRVGGAETSGVLVARPVFNIGVLARPALAERIGLDRYYVLETAAGVDVVGLAGGLAANGAVFERVDADAVGGLQVDGTLNGGAPWPNDPSFPDQWGLHNTGQITACTSPGLPGADISAVGAWGIAFGSSLVTVAVLDGGVNEHADLVGRLVRGRNFADGDPDATGHMNNNHGTYVAGIAAAIQNNGIAIAGVSPNARIMPVRVFNDWGIGFEAEVSSGLVWAADNGADIINMSLGFGPSASTGLLHDAVIYAYESGALLVASSGNVMTQDVLYPAAFDEVIAVGATNNTDTIWMNSTTGPELSLVAPGVGVVSLMDTPGAPDTTVCDHGTSASAPFVSGSAALVMSRYPELSGDVVRTILEVTADDLGDPGVDDVYGWGRVNAERALAYLANSGGVPIRRPVCLADLNGDGLIDINDLLLYLQMFADGAPGADLAPPYGVIDFADIMAYLARFASGCLNGPGGA